MSLVYRKDTSTFPLKDVPFTDLTLNDLFAEALAIKKANCPQWTDESNSDFGNIILWTFTVLISWLRQSLEQQKNNCFLATVVDREALRKICSMLQYTLNESVAASVSVTFTFASGHSEFTILKGTQVSTASTGDAPAIIFEVSEDTIITVDTETQDITCVHGETIDDEIVGSSDGTSNQLFKGESKPVIWQSETVEVYNGNVWVTWSRVSSLIGSSFTSTHYTVSVGVDGFYYINFGDGVTGAIPVRGRNNVKVSYRRGGGSAGNVTASLVNTIVTSITYVSSVINAAAAGGGSDQETMEHAKKYAPASIRTLDRLVTLEDAQTLSNSFIDPIHGRVAKSKAYTTGGLAVHIMIVPPAGGLPSTGLKTALQAYLNLRRLVCTYIIVKNPDYSVVDVTATITAKPNFTAEAVASSVKQALIELIAANYMHPETELYPNDFGRDVYLSDIYAAIDGALGVDHAELTAPVANVTIEDYEIADIGTITLTVNVGTGSTSYVFGTGG